MGWSSSSVGRRRRLAMFGGQGAPGGQLKELRTVVGASAEVRRFVGIVTQELESEAAAVCAQSSERVAAGSAKAGWPFEHGFNVLQWAEGSKKDGVPLAYLNSVAISIIMSILLLLIIVIIII